MVLPSDQSYRELLPKMKQILECGGSFWGKFTCGHCGSRQTFEEGNLLFTSGKCEECGETTLLNRWGLIALFPRED